MLATLLVPETKCVKISLEFQTACVLMDLVVKTIAQVYILQAMLMYTNALYGSFLSSPCTEEFTNNLIVRKETIQLKFVDNVTYFGK